MKIFLIAFLCSAILLPLHVNSQVKNDSITCDTGRNKTMIDGDHCIDYSSISLGRFLQGKVPGLYVRNWTGTPFAESLLAIRNVLSQDNYVAPLVVVNGMRMTGSQSINGYDWLNSIKLSDVESIEILKDAIDLAKYGSVGDRGVIAIKTKKYGDKTLEVNVSSGVNLVPELRKVITGEDERLRVKSLYDKFHAMYGATRNVGNYYPLYPNFVADPYNPYYQGVATDWQKDTYSMGNVTNVAVAVQTKSSDKRYFRIGVSGQSNQGGKKTKYQQVGIDANIGYRVLPKFFFDVHVMESFSRINNNDKLYLPLSAYYPSFADPRFATGAFIDNKYYTDDNTANSLLISSRLTWIINNELKLISAFGLDYKTASKDNFIPSTLLAGITLGQNANEKTQRFNNETYLKYNKQKEGIGLDAKLGFGVYRKEYSRVGSNAFNLSALGAVNYVRVFNGASFPVRALNGAFSYRSVRSAYAGFADINYVFNKSFDVNIYGRVEDNSTLEDKSLKFFPALALNWKLPVERLTSANIKLSAGRTALENSDYYSTLGQVIGIGQYRGINSSTMPSEGVRITQSYNPKLNMPVTDQVDLALDLGFANGASVNLSGYYKATKDFLYHQHFANTASTTDEYRNGMKVAMYGVELNANVHLMKQKNWEWNMNLVATHAQSQINSLPAKYESSSLAQYHDGESLSAIYAYKSVGQDLPEFTDKNNDNVINGVDAVKIADPTPWLYGGLGTTFNGKKLGIELFFSYALGGDVVQESTTERYQRPGRLIVDPASQKNDYFSNYNKRLVYLQPYEDRAHFADHTGNNGHYFIHNYNTMIGDQEVIQGISSVEDASYLRLSSIKVDYQLSKRLKIYATGTNLITIYNKKCGLSPEATMFGVNNFDLAHTGSPLYKTVMFGFSYSL